MNCKSENFHIFMFNKSKNKIGHLERKVSALLALLFEGRFTVFSFGVVESGEIVQAIESSLLN